LFIGGVDVVDEMLSSYSTKRKTNRWPVVVFANMLDISAFNAFTIFNEIDPVFSQKYKKRSRAQFQEKLGLSLASNFLKSNIAPSQSKPANTLENIRSPPSKRIRGKCGQCSNTPQKNNKCDFICSMCSQFLCKSHKLIICQTCTDINSK